MIMSGLDKAGSYDVEVFSGMITCFESVPPCRILGQRFAETRANKVVAKNRVRS
jgi:hypothetical protein